MPAHKDIEMRKAVRNLVKEFPQIYDIRHQHHKDQIVLKNIWNDIGSKVGISGDDANDTWYYDVKLFGNYRRSNKEEPTGSYVYSDFNWYLPFVRTRAQRSSISDPAREAASYNYGENVVPNAQMPGTSASCRQPSFSYGPMSADHWNGVVGNQEYFQNPSAGFSQSHPMMMTSPVPTKRSASGMNVVTAFDFRKPNTNPTAGPIIHKNLPVMQTNFESPAVVPNAQMPGTSASCRQPSFSYGPMSADHWSGVVGNQEYFQDPSAGFAQSHPMMMTSPVPTKRSASGMNVVTACDFRKPNTNPTAGPIIHKNLPVMQTNFESPAVVPNAQMPGTSASCRQPSFSYGPMSADHWSGVVGNPSYFQDPSAGFAQSHPMMMTSPVPTKRSASGMNVVTACDFRKPNTNPTAGPIIHKNLPVMQTNFESPAVVVPAGQQGAVTLSDIMQAIASLQRDVTRQNTIIEGVQRDVTDIQRDVTDIKERVRELERIDKTGKKNC